ncbi:Asp23/Gls24 family envelope stress response protein [Cryobacterium algoritolerans]|uniref:Asp23/Gls24 family envelope stress response protein n=1 Tax=Cryobacterium algoritolerans TaxID=1259184 RepID=A0A4R8WHM1_9MICO|nr:Asp23/Gls24 family envelope stress response protein [Cryobacterium algoritolerans]
MVDTTAFETVAASGTGKTVIADSVVAKIVGIAAREVPGVFALGGGAVRALGAIRDAISGTDLSQGVSIAVDETRVAVEISLVVEYPHELQKVADDVRAAITHAIHAIVGMQVTAVDVTVKDVHYASNTTDEPETPAGPA